MGSLKRISYTHEAMMELIITRPELDQNEIAAHFGYSPSWISNVLASDAFQSRMAARREEVIDPELRATLEERFRALAIRSLQVLQEKLSKPAVSDQVALRAAELGARACGVGGFGAANPSPGPSPAQDRLERLANRLIILQSTVRERTLNAQDGVSVEVIPEAG